MLLHDEETGAISVENVVTMSDFVSFDKVSINVHGG